MKSTKYQSRPTAKTLIILPTLGQRIDLLQKTLESFGLQGAYAPDVIIVCPIKCKDVRRLAKSIGAKIADDPGTLSGAINVGISSASPDHKYIAWLGDDDLLRPGSLEASVTALEMDNDAVIAYGYCDYIGDNDELLFTNKAGKLAPWLISWGPNLIPLPGMLYRKTSLEMAGKFDISLKYSMDLDMLLRLRCYGTFVNTGKTLAAFRWHSSSTTVANRNASLAEARSVKRTYLPTVLRPFSFIWEVPVAIATKIASRRVNSIANKTSLR